MAQLEALLNIICTSAYNAAAEYNKLGSPVPNLDSADQHPLDIAADTLELKKAIRLLEAGCNMLCSMLAPPAHTIINRTQNLDRECINVALNSEVADILQESPNGLHISKISEKVGIEQDKLGRILRFLATEHCFHEIHEGVFANNRLSVALLSKNNISALAKLQTTIHSISGPVLYENLVNPLYSQSTEPSESPFMQAVKNENIKGGIFDWINLHPKIHELFGNAMLGMGDVMGNLSILHHYPWENVSSVCDVGSGTGHFALPLSRYFPRIQVHLFDLPDVIGYAKQYLERENPEAIKAKKTHFASGDFFIELPQEIRGLDLYYLRNIIHNWPDARARTILTNVSMGMKPHSRLLIHDYVIYQSTSRPNTSEIVPDSQMEVETEKAPEPLLSNFGMGNMRLYNQDITMLLNFNSKERTVSEVLTLVKDLDLKLVKVWDIGETYVLELIKL